MKTRTSTAGNKGFTLLELLVVLFIVGLASSVVIFSGAKLRDKMQFNDEAKKIYLSAKYARETAILERREVVLKVNEEANTYWLDYGDARTAAVHAVPPAYPLAGRDIFFYPKGNSSGGLIEIRNEKGQKYAIEVSKILGTSTIKRL